MKDIDADYYGYRDEDDGVIVPLELEAQKEAVIKAIEDFQQGKNVEMIPQEFEIESEDSESEDEGKDSSDFKGPKRFMSHVPYIPSQEDVQKELLRRKKEELMSKYASETLLEKEQQAKQLSGIQ